MKTKNYIIALFVALICSLNTFAQNQQKIDEYTKQIETNKANGNKAMEANFLNKAANLYWDNENYDKAIELFSSSLEINKQLGNKNGITQITFFIARIYEDKGDYENAVTHYQTGVGYKRNTAGKLDLSNSLYRIGNVYNMMGKHTESNKYLDEALTNAFSIDDQMVKWRLMKMIYLKMVENHQKLGNNSEASRCMNLRNQINNEISAEEIRLKQLQTDAAIHTTKKVRNDLDSTTKVVIEKDALVKKSEKQLALEKKEKEELQRQKELDDLRYEMEMKQSETIRNYLIIIVVIILISLAIVTREYKEKKKANKKLERQNLILENQKIEIEQQKEEIQKQNSHILSSIRYARKIQEAILPSKIAIQGNIPNSFIFYQPRDIVSGDFYWFSKQEDYLFIAAVDCTGHSVPGAFMSMIGHTLLNEIVNEKGIYNPSDILKRLNAGVIGALKQDEEEASQEDGMDLTMCRIDTKNKSFDIACANHVAFIVRDKKVERVEGDIFSIGGIFSMKPNLKFTTHHFDIEEKTTIYMFSDGYQDQFGGANNKKFMEKRLLDMLIDGSSLPMKEQGDIADRTFNEWKGGLTQIDDVLLIGVELNV